MVDDGAVVMVILAVLRRRVSESRAICGDAGNFASEQIDYDDDWNSGEMKLVTMVRVCRFGTQACGS